MGPYNAAIIFLSDTANLDLHAVEALVHVAETLIHVIEAPVHVLVHVAVALVQVKEILFPRLFGMRKSLIHAFLEVERVLAHGLDALLGEFVRMVEPFVHAPRELAELACPDVLVGHRAYPQ